MIKLFYDFEKELMLSALNIIKNFELLGHLFKLLFLIKNTKSINSLT